MSFNYPKICRDLLSGLPQRQKEVLTRRFGLNNGERETLEAIGQGFSVTRERVRQIENDGLEKIKPKIKNYIDVFQHFRKYLQGYGGLRKEETIFNEIGSSKTKNQVFFLLTIGNDFERFNEDENFYSFWTIDQNSFEKAKKIIDSTSRELEKIGKPLAFKKLMSLPGLNPKVSQNILSPCLEISKDIMRSEDGLLGLKDWPEVNPRGVKDKVYLVLKRENKPLHFTELARLVKGSLVQTVHNELIRDQRFVLAGRGVYVLREWGYEPGQVKDVILKILKEERKPLAKEEILRKVLKQRLVKENTVLLNLGNQKYFAKDSQGRFFASEV